MPHRLQQPFLNVLTCYTVMVHGSYCTWSFDAGTLLNTLIRVRRHFPTHPSRAKACMRPQRAIEGTLRGGTIFRYPAELVQCIGVLYCLVSGCTDVTSARCLMDRCAATTRQYPPCNCTGGGTPAGCSTEVKASHPTFMATSPKLNGQVKPLNGSELVRSSGILTWHTFSMFCMPLGATPGCKHPHI